MMYLSYEFKQNQLVVNRYTITQFYIGTGTLIYIKGL